MKTSLKRMLSKGLGWSNYALYRNQLNDGLTIFVYHDVSDYPSSFSKNHDLNVKPEIFDFQVGFLKKYFNFISPDDLLAGKIPRRAAMITFDDGLSGYFNNALPILSKHRVPSISFMNMSTVKGELMWAGVLIYLAQLPDFVDFLVSKRGGVPQDRSIHSVIDQKIVQEYFQKSGLRLDQEIREFTGEIVSEEVMREADADPYVYFGNHLDNHYISLLLSDDDLLSSFRRNQEALSQYSSSRNIFSFPFGQPGIHFRQRHVSLLLENGAEKVLFSSGGLNNDSSSELLDRVSMFSFDNTAGKIWFRILRKRN